MQNLGNKQRNLKNKVKGTQTTLIKKWLKLPIQKLKGL
jgi:hypothetical protein